MIKRIGYMVLLAILVITLGLGFSPASKAQAAGNAAPLAEDEAGTAYVPGQLIVGLAPSVSLGSIAWRAEAAAEAIGAKVLKTDAGYGPAGRRKTEESAGAGADAQTHKGGELRRTKLYLQVGQTGGRICG